MCETDLHAADGDWPKECIVLNLISELNRRPTWRSQLMFGYQRESNDED